MFPFVSLDLGRQWVTKIAGGYTEGKGELCIELAHTSVMG